MQQNKLEEAVAQFEAALEHVTDPHEKPSFLEALANAKQRLAGTGMCLLGITFSSDFVYQTFFRLFVLNVFCGQPLLHRVALISARWQRVCHGPESYF